MRKHAAVFAALFVLILSAALLAEEGGPMCGKMGRGMIGPRMVLAMSSELNLTADQMDKIKKIIDAMPAKGSHMEEMQKDRDALKEEMQKEKPDQAKIGALIDKIAAKKKAAIKEKLKNKEAMNAILTAEQKDLLKKKAGEWKDKKKGKKDCPKMK